MKEECDSTIEKKFAAECVTAGLRVDGRNLDRPRRARVELAAKYGDAQAYIGRSRAISRCIVTSGIPLSERPRDGTLTITVATESGDAEEESELRGILERILRDARALDTEALCILSGKLVWNVKIHVSILVDDGAQIDTAVLAAMGSLLHARRPDVTVKGTNVTIHPEDEREPIPLPIHHVPVCVTFAIFETPRDESGIVHNAVVMDPSRKEEVAANASTSIAMNSNGEVCSIFKPGGAPVKPMVLVKCAQMAEERAVEITRLLANTLKDDAEKHPLNTARPMMCEKEPVAHISGHVNIDGDGDDDGDVKMIITSSGAWNATPKAEAPPPNAPAATTPTTGKKMDINGKEKREVIVIDDENEDEEMKGNEEVEESKTKSMGRKKKRNRRKKST